MAKRGRKPKNRSFGISLQKDTIFSILSLGLIAFSVISGLSLVYPQEGIFLQLIATTLTETFGLVAFLIPMFFLYLGFFLFRNLKWKVLETRILLGILLFLASLVGILKSMGGFLGEKTSDFFSSYFSSLGSTVLFASLCLISQIIIWEIKIETIFSFLGKLALVFMKLPKILLSLNLPFPKKGSFSKEVDLEDQSSNEPELSEFPKKELKEKEFEVVENPKEPVVETKKTVPLKAKEATSQEMKTPGSLPYNDVVWEYPPLSILADPSQIRADRGDVKSRALVIEKTLDSFGIRSKVVEVNKGPAVTQYALETVQGTKIAKITSLQNDLALALASPTGSVRIEAPIPGRSLIGVEVPNNSSELVTLKEIMLSDKVSKAKSKLAIALGKDVSGAPISYDIAKMPHVLVAGSTGSGKSIMIHSIISTLLFRCSPQECKFVLVDPKRVELVGYRDIPHLLTPVIVDVNKAVPAFKWAISEMERRYRLLENAKVRDIDSYNDLSGFQALPYIVIIVDELADLMMTSANDVEKAICRIAQLARAVGIHLVLATQRPSVDVLTGLIKANIPCRIAFNVTSQIDSRVIIDQPGAEKLLGRGDMLFVPPDASKPIRIQGVFVSDKEREALGNYLRESAIKPEYNDIVLRPQAPKEGEVRAEPTDEYFAEAVRLVVTHKRASSSLLQRKLSIGYARAARLLDELEANGVVSSGEGSKPRDVLISDAEKYLSNENSR